MKEPKGVALDLEGNVWGVNTANSNIQKWTPHGNGYGSDPSAHTSQTIYYTAGTNSLVAACGSHPEWANLPCQTQPAAQPEGSLPKLETITVTYNIWDEPLTTTNMSGTTERKTTDTYDAAGRVKTTSTASPVGTALPTVTDKYNEETGALEEQSTTTEGKTKAITNHFNTLGAADELHGRQRKHGDLRIRSRRAHREDKRRQRHPDLYLQSDHGPPRRNRGLLSVEHEVHRDI